MTEETDHVLMKCVRCGGNSWAELRDMPLHKTSGTWIRCPHCSAGLPGEPRLEAALNAEASPQGMDDGPVRRWRHKKRGSAYTVVGEGEMQVSTGEVVYIPCTNVHQRPIGDGDRLIAYQGDDGKLWFRFPDEFYDGRFEALTTSPREQEGASVPAWIEMIECVQLVGADPTVPADPMWRVNISGRCFDFETEIEASNLVDAINTAHPPRPAGDGWKEGIEAAIKVVSERAEICAEAVKDSPDGIGKAGLIFAEQECRNILRQLRALPTPEKQL